MPLTAKTWMTQARATPLKRIACYAQVLCIHVLAFTVALPPAWMMSAVFHTEVAMASSYTVGYSKYQRGDFKGAELALRQALAKKMDRATMGKTFKLLGICQFMLGNKNAASDSFRRALQAVPSTAVSPSEVLDDTVVPFFNSVKAQARKSAPKKPAAKVATKTRPTKAAPAKTAPPPAPAKTIAGGNKPLKQTYLKVLSNVPSASVSIDGILAGQANSLINTDPGKVMIDVAAPGYRPRTVTVNVTANRENTVTVNLVKPQPKPKPKPKPKPQPIAKPKSKASPSVAQKQRPQKKRPNKYTPDPGADMFAESGTGGGGGGGGVDLASQFEAEAAGYAAPQAQPGYGAQPGFAPPPQYYAPPPQYYAPPPPQYYAPPPPPQYYAPPPPPPPPADPYAGGGYADAGPVEAAQDPAAANSSGGNSGGSGGSGNNLFITLLPFGAGQFQNGSMLLGLTFLAAEGAAVYYYMSKSKEADDFAKGANTFIEQNCKQEDSDVDECAKYEKDSKAYVSEVRGKAMLGLYGFAGLWAVGVAEAILNEPKPQPKKRKKQRRYGGFAYTPTIEGHHFSLLGKENVGKLYAYEVGLNVIPAGTMSIDAPTEFSDKNQLSLSLTLEF